MTLIETPAEIGDEGLTALIACGCAYSGTACKVQELVFRYLYSNRKIFLRMSSIGLELALSLAGISDLGYVFAEQLSTYVLD